MPDRLAWPITVAADGRLAVVQQDSDEDITQCLLAIRRTRLGERPDLPTMGVPDLEFGEQPVDVEGVAEVLGRHEPRVTSLLDSQPDAVDQMLANETDAWERPQISDEES